MAPGLSLGGRERVNGRTLWRCRCDCGTEQLVGLNNLRAGQSTCCWQCGVTKRSGKASSRWSGFQELPGQFWAKIKQSAKRRNIPFSLTIEEAWDKFVGQERRCAVSGVEIQFAPDTQTRHSLQTASLDRIDSNRGYTLDNVQWVHKVVNFMKHSLDQDELLLWCQRIVENQLTEIGYGRA